MRQPKDRNQKYEILEKLYVKYAKLIYFVAFDILKDNYLAEDVVQMAFLKLEKSNIDIDSISSNKTRAFICIVARNISIDMLQNNKKEICSIKENEVVELPDKELPPLDLLINKEKVAQLKNDLRQLSDKNMDVFLLRYFNQLSIAEIASTLDITEQSVRVRLHRAKKTLLEKVNG